MTAEWLDLFGYATPEELLTLVEVEPATTLYFGGLRAAGVPLAEAFQTPAALDVLAGVCVELHGTPGELMEGRQ
jgi:hypothetical protein